MYLLAVLVTSTTVPAIIDYEDTINGGDEVNFFEILFNLF